MFVSAIVVGACRSFCEMRRLALTVYTTHAYSNKNYLPLYTRRVRVMSNYKVTAVIITKPAALRASENTEK